MSAADDELATVASHLRKLEPARVARVLRETIDQLYDGQRTGRYRWDQLYKTEKTHCGTLVEINLQREFLFQDGEVLDFRIAGAEVDCKFSQKMGGWMIPPEARGHLCMVAWAEDSASPRWSLGLIRIQPEFLNLGSNRDAKSTLNSAGRGAIDWLWKDAAMPANVLLQLERAAVDRIMGSKHGTKRLNELFRAAQGRIVGRGAVATTAQQHDYMKRIRAAGGSRTALKGEGIVILGQYHAHVSIAKALGVPAPGPGDSISVRVVPAAEKEAGAAAIGESWWRVARSEDPVVPAPDLPEPAKKKKSPEE